MQLILKSEPTAALRTMKVLLTNTADDSPYMGVAPGVGDVKVMKPGGAEADHAGTWTHVANGLWHYTPHVGEIDTSGVISLRVAKPGLYADVFTAQVVAFDPNAATNMGLTHLDAAVTSRLAGANYQSVTDWLDEPDTIETGLSMRGAFRLLCAVLAARVTGARTGTEYFRAAVSDHKVRVTATLDANGNRPVVVTDTTD